MSKNRTLFILCLLIVHGITFAQHKVKVFGYVLDEKKQPVEAANVHLIKENRGTTTSGSGYFELEIPASDTTDIVFSFLGYEKSARTFLPSEKDYFVTVKLKESSNMLEGVTVTENRRQINSMQNVDISKTRLLSDPSGGSIESLIVTFAGVNSNNELSSQYSVRGGNFDENSVYINGTEVYRPLLMRAGQQEGLSIINPDMVEKVSFSAGGYDAKYTDKMASVLDITYKKPSEFEAGVSASLMGASAYIGSASRNFSQLYGIRFKRNTTFLSTLQEKGEYDPSFLDFQTHLTWDFAKDWDLTFLGNVSRNEYNFTPQSRSTQFGNYMNAKKFKVYFEGKEEDLFQTLFGAMTLTRKLNEDTKLRINASAFNTNEHETYDITGQYWLSDVGDPEDSNDISSGVGTYHEHARNRLQALVLELGHSGETKVGSTLFEWGVNYKRERIKDKMREWEMRDSAGYSLPSTGDKVNVFYNLQSKNDVSSNRFAGYIQDNYKWVNSSGFWGVTGGVRLSYWSFNNEFLASPRANISFVPHKNPNLTFRFSTGLYYQSPFYKEFRDTVNVNGNVIVKLNKHIKSQRSLQFIGGGDYNFRSWGRPFRFTAEAYYKALDNLIPYTIDNVRVTYAGKNEGHGYATGVDFKLFGEFVPGTDSWISLSLMKSEEKIRGKWVPRPTEQRYSFSLFFQDYFPSNPKYKFNLKAVLADGVPVSPPHKGMDGGFFRTPAYKRIDCGVSRQLVGNQDKFMHNGFFSAFKSIWIALDLFNIANFKNVNSYYWVTDINNNQYAVPNYLTSFQVNLRLTAEF